MSAQTSQEPRAVAAQIVKQVTRDQRSLDPVLEEHFKKNNKDSALIHELAAGTLRWWWRLTAQADELLDKPLKSKDFDLYCLIVTGLYQLQFTRIPDHAAVSQTVSASKLIGKQWSSRLVNALMRRFIRERDVFTERFKYDPSFVYSHPDWIIEKLKSDWPDDWDKILKANNEQQNLTIRVNNQKTTVDQVCQSLQEQQIKFSKTQDSPVGVRILDKTKIWQSELWRGGLVCVQDESAQLTTYMTKLEPGMRVLDACAAPGGKTCHLLERQPELKLLALEVEPARVGKLKQNLNRLNLDCETKVADAGDPQSWWDGRQFDLILIDAPCSGSGVINKHPDIKHLRRVTDIEQNVQTQRRLLDKLWPVLKAGGQLLYCTCSVFRQENDQQAQWFINKYANAKEIALDDRFGRKMPFGRQRLPSDYESDGFYYAGFSKTTN